MAVMAVVVVVMVTVMMVAVMAVVVIVMVVMLAGTVVVIAVSLVIAVVVVLPWELEQLHHGRSALIELARVQASFHRHRLPLLQWHTKTRSQSLTALLRSPPLWLILHYQPSWPKKRKVLGDLVSDLFLSVAVVAAAAAVEWA